MGPGLLDIHRQVGTTDEQRAAPGNAIEVQKPAQRRIAIGALATWIPSGVIQAAASGVGARGFGSCQSIFVKSEFSILFWGLQGFIDAREG